MRDQKPIATRMITLLQPALRDIARVFRVKAQPSRADPLRRRGTLIAQPSAKNSA